MVFSKQGQITHGREKFEASNFSRSAEQLQDPATLCCSQIDQDLKNETADAFATNCRKWLEMKVLKLS